MSYKKNRRRKQIPQIKLINNIKHKKCITCNEFKMADNFYKHAGSALNCQNECKDCMSLYYKERNTKEKNRITQLQKYGLTVEQYKILYDNQNGKCAICFKYFDKLHIDHDHVTEIVRGLLCNDCNTGIGMLKDDIEILWNAIRYLTTRGF